MNSVLRTPDGVVNVRPRAMRGPCKADSLLKTAVRSPPSPPTSHPSTVAEKSILLRMAASSMTGANTVKREQNHASKRWSDAPRTEPPAPSYLPRESRCRVASGGPVACRFLDPTRDARLYLSLTNMRYLITTPEASQALHAPLQ